MISKRTQALAMLNTCFESDDGGVPTRGILTEEDYRLLVEALMETSAPEGGRYVWGVWNKTSFAIFTTEEGAQAYVSSFPGSVGGGMSITKMPVFEASPPPQRGEESK